MTKYGVNNVKKTTVCNSRGADELQFLEILR